MEAPLTEVPARVRPGRLFYSRWLILVLMALTLVLGAEWLLIWKSNLGPEETVCQQIEALQKKDYAEAYRFSATEVRARLGPDEFRAMVERQFPEMVEARRYEIRERFLGQDRCRFLVTITGSDGSSLDLLYVLGREEGRWRVRAVVPRRNQPLPQPEVKA